MNTLEAVVLKQCVATHDFVGVAATDLHLRKGDLLDVLDVCRKYERMPRQTRKITHLAPPSVCAGLVAMVARPQLNNRQTRLFSKQSLCSSSSRNRPTTTNTQHINNNNNNPTTKSNHCCSYCCDNNNHYNYN